MAVQIPRVPNTALRTGASAPPDLDARIRQLEERIAMLEAVIKIDGTRVDIKTTGRMSIKAASLYLDAGPRGVTAGGKPVAVKDDRVTGETRVPTTGLSTLINGRIA